MKKVVKFGGSSLANAEQFEKVGDIIRSEESDVSLFHPHLARDSTVIPR